tara:strand:+ start:5514 stop:6536 length:1023 start_codon:yes stop_codon:yes gene_type:complete
MKLAILTLVSALSISAIAALYSLLGLAAIFSAAAIPVLLMGGVLEVGKLVTASWLYHNWKRTPILLKSYLSLAVVVLIFITSMGIFGFLSKAHLDQTMTVGDNSLEIAQLDNRLKRQNMLITDADNVIVQLDAQIATLIEYDRIRGPEGSIQTRISQKDERAELNVIIESAMDEVSILQDKKLVLSKEQIELEAEIGPLKYIAELIYGADANQHFDEAVRWVILVLIFVFDPLAVLLLIAANQSLRDARRVKIDNENITDFTEIDSNDIETVETPEDKTEQEIKTETKPAETSEVKMIVSEDERELWEKFQTSIRNEKKVVNSGVTQVDYIVEEQTKKKE